VLPAVWRQLTTLGTNCLVRTCTVYVAILLVDRSTVSKKNANFPHGASIRVRGGAQYFSSLAWVVRSGGAPAVGSVFSALPGSQSLLSAGWRVGTAQRVVQRDTPHGRSGQHERDHRALARAAGR
jgi:hypothetical protein